MTKDFLTDKENIEYHFSVYEKGSKTKLIEEEIFERQHFFNISQSSTYNHVFNNRYDFYNHKYIPRVYERFNYTEPSELFDDRFVSTIVLQFNQQNYDNLEKYHNYPSKDYKDLKAQMIYISPYVVKVFQKVSFNLSGDRSITNRKLSYKITDIEDENGRGLYKRKAIKLRANQSDPTYIREKLVYSLADAMGIPTQGCTFTRLIINKKSIGLFTLVDHISSYNFMKEVLNNGNEIKKKDDALLFKVDNVMTSVGNMIYYGNDVDVTDMKYKAYELKKSSFCKEKDIAIEDYEEKAKKDQLLPFFKKIDELTKYNIAFFEKKIFHVDSFLRSLVLDYLCQGVDNYLFWASNYYMYKSANKEKKDYRWYFISTDFHFTFGSDGFAKQIKGNFYNQSAYNTEIEVIRQPLTKLLEIDYNEYSRRIETIIYDTIKTAFNTPVLYAYIESLIQMIYNDVQWDLLLPRMNLNGKTGKLNNIDFFLFCVTDVKNLLTSPMPIKTYIRYKVKYLLKYNPMDIPKSLDDIQVGSLGYTTPKFSSIFTYDEVDSLPQSIGSTIFYHNKNITFNLFILIIVTLFLIVV
ncbi:hypothetical protein BCR36DRAFT_273153 [Piromyces finnis]|uniref:Coth-domain-containing protein n=1 Tax=Piromyces finnis TaxID=1754191 RepID=A0A1Y1VQY4_9FUNG|nr:hypothetical protein BCR36DRAFT_273153 [Piromyces finnis]|eukprot:ORX61271.1 hypothetical protein BCR36DRAFT_273153 [Piromyces finnis]